ncbi:sigma-70 family RNA polymerase sigma factor [Permianibacter sp. IMCC34836]|uniref:RNA polymerase sigma factor n=1 Tax=Permianibacter fluminis TaxID=2738515 RepID=UPI00155544C3|nr:sigma-70 family RNA polymerase sigma factor [Permianibacter fluminis]NQD37796.1 sigma-70 family RNA polymerase sigma factor [Permianibacter fluminis]
MTTDIGLTEVDWAALYQRLEKPLYNAAYRYIWQRLDAQDLVQEAFLQLWQRRAQISLETADRYLWVTTLNLARKRRRWRSLRQFLSIDSLQMDDVHRDGIPELLAATPSPEQQLQDGQQDQRLLDAIDALSEKLRSVLLLTEFSELPYEVVAQMLEIPAGTVASRRHLALKKLRTTLADMDYSFVTGAPGHD